MCPVYTVVCPRFNFRLNFRWKQGKWTFHPDRRRSRNCFNCVQQRHSACATFSCTSAYNSPACESYPWSDWDSKSWNREKANRAGQVSLQHSSTAENYVYAGSFFIMEQVCLAGTNSVIYNLHYNTWKEQKYTSLHVSRNSKVMNSFRNAANHVISEQKYYNSTNTDI